MSIFTREFWAFAGERALRTTAQTAGATLVANATGLFTVDFVELSSVSLLAGVISLLMYIATPPKNDVTVEDVEIEDGNEDV